MTVEISKLKTEVSISFYLLKLILFLQAPVQTTLSNEAVHNSEEFKTLKKYYSLAVKEYERVSKEMEEVTYERDKLRNISEQRFYAMCDEQTKTLKEIQVGFL